MTAGITLFCDGTRHGQPCRGRLLTGAQSPDEARHLFGKPAGWTSTWEAFAPRTYRARDLCPSRGHDECPA